jgi:hypothetical protein
VNYTAKKKNIRRKNKPSERIDLALVLNQRKKNLPGATTENTRTPSPPSTKLGNSCSPVIPTSTVPTPLSTSTSSSTA